MIFGVYFCKVEDPPTDGIEAMFAAYEACILLSKPQH